MEYKRAQMEHNWGNRENFRALLKSIVGNLKCIIGLGLSTIVKNISSKNTWNNVRSYVYIDSLNSFSITQNFLW